MCRLVPRSVIALLLLAAILLPIVIILTAGMSFGLASLGDVWGQKALRYISIAFVILWMFDFILLVLALAVHALEDMAGDDLYTIEEDESELDPLDSDALEEAYASCDTPDDLDDLEEEPE